MTVQSSGTHTLTKSIPVWIPQAAILPSPWPPFISFTHLTQTSDFIFTLLVVWPLPHHPNGSKRFYGCPHGNHSVNGGMCYLLLAFTIAAKHIDESRRTGRGETAPSVMVRMNTGIDAMWFREEVYFKMWISFMAMKSFILYLISCSGFCFVSMMQGECFHCIWMY